jgi:hypothetical protein
MCGGIIIVTLHQGYLVGIVTLLLGDVILNRIWSLLPVFMNKALIIVSKTIRP